MEKLLELFSRKDLISIKGCKTELGCKTERINLSKHRFCELEDWLRSSKKNSIRFIFENETIEFNS